MKTKLIDFILYGIMYVWWKIKAQRSITIKEQTDRPSSYDLPCGS
jgi:hypothetical protein